MPAIYRHRPKFFKNSKSRQKTVRPTADEIEQMIIKKALLDAKVIERGY